VPETSTVIATPEGPRSSCCRAEIEVTKEYTDTVVYVATELEVDENGTVISVGYHYVKTYDGTDGENFTVQCRSCLREIDTSVIEFEEC
jgi:hypothetical protein